MGASARTPAGRRNRAREFAAAFGSGEEAFLAGVLHDLGKYSDVFTRRLEGTERGLDHWSLGAWAALTKYREAGLAAALAIQGQHSAFSAPTTALSVSSTRRFSPLGILSSFI